MQCEDLWFGRQVFLNMNTGWWTFALAAANEPHLTFTQHVVPTCATCSHQWDNGYCDANRGLISVLHLGAFAFGTVPYGTLRSQC